MSFTFRKKGKAASRTNSSEKESISVDVLSSPIAKRATRKGAHAKEEHAESTISKDTATNNPSEGETKQSNSRKRGRSKTAEKPVVPKEKGDSSKSNNKRSKQTDIQSDPTDTVESHLTPLECYKICSETVAKTKPKYIISAMDEVYKILERPKNLSTGGGTEEIEIVKPQDISNMKSHLRRLEKEKNDWINMRDKLQSLKGKNEKTTLSNVHKQKILSMLNSKLPSPNASASDDIKKISLLFKDILAAIVNLKASENRISQAAIKTDNFFDEMVQKLEAHNFGSLADIGNPKKLIEAITAAPPEAPNTEV